MHINSNYLTLQGSYLFSEIAKRVRIFQENNPGKPIIRLGIGDVTLPLVPAVITGLKNAVEEMADAKTFKGYGPEQGYDFLRNSICEHDFVARGINIQPDEIFVSTGAKEDMGNFQELFSDDAIIAIPDPVYPVYVDSNVMAGRGGNYIDGRYENFVYLECTAENNYSPDLPTSKVDVIYLCSPSNPTGKVFSKEELTRWVEYAKENQALILFDAAYECFIQDNAILHSIYEIPGAQDVAVEFRSFSKTAGFTGTRCSYTVVPKTVFGFSNQGESISLNSLWNRRQTTKFNGTAYIIQKGAAEIFTEQGEKEVKCLIGYYMENARIIRDGIESLGFQYSGGIHAPYIWFKIPDNFTSSWDFFDVLLEKCQVVGTPGAGFGKCGERYFRLSSFGERINVQEAIERLKKM